MRVIAIYFLPVRLTFSERHRHDSQPDKPDALPRTATLFHAYWVDPSLYKYFQKYHVINYFIFLKHVSTYQFHYPGVTSNNSEK